MMTKIVLALIVAVVGVAGVVAGCGGSPALTCQTTNCSSGTLTYQICSHADGSISYAFGGMSCSCTGANSTQCQTCSTEVANYCTGGGGATGGTGGGGSGGGGGGGGSTTCTATFTGGFTGTYSPCAVNATYTASSGSWNLATAGNAVPGTSYTWTGFSMTLTGMAATGTFDQTTSMGSSDQVTIVGSGNAPLWEAAHGQSQTLGSASVNVMSLGASTDIGNGNLLYSSPHGTWTATLVDQNPMTAMPNVMQSVTF